MRYLLRTNTNYEHLANKFKRAVLTRMGARRLRNGSLSTKIFCSLALFSEREWPLRASTFCHVVLDLLFYDIFAQQKIVFLEIPVDVIACDLWFGPPPIKNPGYAYVCINKIWGHARIKHSPA